MLAPKFGSVVADAVRRLRAKREESLRVDDECARALREQTAQTKP